MYEEFFGLSEKPFSLTPNPRFVFQSDQYRTAEEALLYGIGQKEGFMLVTGSPGTGKTTLCRDLLEKLDAQKHRVALLFNPFLNGVEMLQALLSEFGVGDVKTTSRKELLDLLNTYLLQQLANGRSCIAIFDEAQHLSTEFLEQIRVLSNLETDREKLIQIILVGQPELLTLIRTPQMAQLDQRVSVRCVLAHLSREETGRYVHHRLNVAGAKGRVRFQEKAVALMHSATGGVPRLVNLCADRALLAAYTAQTRAVDESHVRQALAALKGEEGIDAGAASAAPQAPKTLSSSRPKSRRPIWISAIAAGVVALAALFWWSVDGDAELLAWQAARTSSSAEAERTYETIARDHRASRHRETALLRLAQFQIARGANGDALRWLDVLMRDYPAGRANAERQYWTARAYLGSGDTTRACDISHRMPSAADVPSDREALARQCDAFAVRLKTDSAKGSTPLDSAHVRPAGSPMRGDSTS